MKKYFAIFIIATASIIMSCNSPAPDEAAPDTTAPTAGTAISFSGTSATATTVSWGAASDDATPSASLQYKLVRASSAVAIDTIAEVDAITGADLIIGWTTNALTSTVSDLTAETAYYFAALVRDTAGNTSLYAPQSIATSTAPDTTAPTAGTAISFSGTTVTATTVSWGAASDAITPAASLQYKLVRASAANAIDSAEEADAISGADLVMDWTANALTRTNTNLTPSTTYYFAVLVKDAANNMNLYAPVSATTASDTSPPTTGTAITASGISSTSMTISWGAATDNVTASSQLQYKLAYGPNFAAMDSIEEVNAITGTGLVMDWTTNALTKAVTGLPTPEWPYYFSVLVRDAAGNIGRYDTLEAWTAAAPDTTAPTTGTSISFSRIENTAATATWGAATDNVTSPASLQYKLVRASASASIDTVAEANAISDANLVMDWTANVTSRTATGLTPSTIYYFAAVVRDSAGNMSLYTPQSVTTSFTPNRDYNLNTSPGSEWTVGASDCDWEWGAVSAVGPIGSVCYGTHINGTYSPLRTYESNYVQLGPMNLSGYSVATGFRMNFQIFLQVEYNYDYCQLQYSTNGSVFTPVPASSITGYPYTSTDTNAWSPNPTMSGHEPAWRDVSVNLGSLGLNGCTLVYFRWALRTDESGEDAGVYIDNVNIGY